MSEYNTLTYNDRQAELEAAKAAFFASGGQIEVAQPFQYVPRPAATVSAADQKNARQLLRDASYEKQRASKEARQAVEDQVRKLAETMTYREAELASGYSHTTLYRIARSCGFKFQPDPMLGHGVRSYIDPVADAKLRDRVIAMRDLGVNRTQAAKHIGISPATLIRVLKDHAIDFPKAKTGGNLRAKKCAA